MNLSDSDTGIIQEKVKRESKFSCNLNGRLVIK